MAQDDSMQKMQQGSCFNGGSAAYLEALYEAYLADPTTIDDNWRDYFAQLPKTSEAHQDISHAEIRQYFKQRAKAKKITVNAVSDSSISDNSHERQQTKILQLINAYRSHGHHHATLDPLNLAERHDIADLYLEHYGLSTDDLSTQFDTQALSLSSDSQFATLSEIHQRLVDTYCQNIGVEYMHITNVAEVKWLRERLEVAKGIFNFSVDEKSTILDGLVAAEGLEKYLGRKYVGQKRFSLEGSDSLIPLMNCLVQRAGSQGVKELVIGMAHRGRLNVLVNTVGKVSQNLFNEFAGKNIDTMRSGDVKYHLGFSSDIKTPGGMMHLTLGFNPSHLEIISPVIVGSVRSRQDRRFDEQKSLVVPVIIHGDAAFAGQGVVMETFNMSQARGYRVGGTVHIVINNQIGFTTSNPLDSRSTLYCTDVAKMVQAPIFHVNGDDPESVVFACQVAFDYRMKFNKDVVIDLVSYRRHGHNEADEPLITQPLMYRNIKQHPTPLTLYAQKLVSEDTFSQENIDDRVAAYRQALDDGHAVVKTVTDIPDDELHVDWRPYVDHKWSNDYDNNMTQSQLHVIADKLLQLPDNFALQPQVAKEMANRRKMNQEELPIQWGFAETLAYATLLEQGYSVRISGQDSGRGTFSHRHAVLHDYQTGDTHTPLAQINADNTRFTVIDSILSEEAVLGFEYGYASAEPNVLVIWEAQFGDFVNGAQVVIDQFISSAEQKWGRLCNLTLLLPHGYEGMGPEHSSARLERFLQLCAQHNMQVCVPSTPAQCYHMLRRQMLRPLRKPLVVMTPKSLLRHKLATSSFSDLAKGKFHLVIPEVDDIRPKQTKRVVLCSGKVYYDLLQKRREDKRTDVAIIRVEQLYPFPKEELHEQLAMYEAADVVWCQEEPKNQGAWFSCHHNLVQCLAKHQELSYAGRSASAAPAVGYLATHIEEQKALVKEALG